MESQNIEYKQSWRDDFLKEICGFANAQGGTLYIGMDDKGDVCGAEDAKRLMEDLPNKVRDILGIIVDVQLLEKDGEKYIEKHSLQAFNPSLANAFFRTGDIEAWGRGYRRIARLMKEAKLLPPKLEKDNGLMVTFYADIKQQLKEQMGLTERQTIIVDWIKDNPKTSYAKMSQKLAISTSTLKRELSLLQEKEYILHDGKTSSGEWIVPMFIIN